MAILAVVGIVGYGLVKSDFFSGVGGGVGDAVGGVGAGVGYAGQAAGYNLADVFSAVGQLGKESTLIIRESGQIIREVQTEVRQDLVPTIDYLGDIPRDIAQSGSEWSGSLRDVSGGWARTFEQVWNPESEVGIIQTAGNIGSWLTRGTRNVFDWVTKTASPDDRSLTADKSIITASVIAPTTTSYSSPNVSVSSSSGSVRTPTTTTRISDYSPSENVELLSKLPTIPIPTDYNLGDVMTPTPIIDDSPWWKIW